MKRQIYEVYAKVVGSDGSYSTLSGYPKAFDSRNYNNDIDKTLMRATGEFASTWVLCVCVKIVNYKWLCL